MAMAVLPRLHRRRRIGFVVGFTLILLLAIWGVFLRGSSAMAGADNAGTVAVTQGSLSVIIASSGTVAPEQSLNLSFPVGGTVAEVLVKAGDTVTAGQALVRLDDRNLQIQLASAQAGLSIAQASYSKVAAGSAKPDIEAAQAALASAQAAYDAAAKSADSSDSQLQAALASMQKAEVVLKQAQTAYDGVSWRSDIGSRPEAAALENATIDYLQAKANYDALVITAGTDAQAKTQSAAAQLQQAQANLAKVQSGATSNDLTIAQANVTQAEQSLKQAKLNLDAGTLKVPFSGTVAAMNVVPGSTVNSSTSVLSLIDRSTLHVDLKLNEYDVTNIQIGQPVDLTIDSLPGWKAQGTVTYIAPAADVANGVVTYAVRTTFPDKDPVVRLGMTASVNILAAHKDGVLLLPNSALLPKGAGHSVQVKSADGKTVEEIDVQTGLTDGMQTEIISGLQEGDRVIANPSTGTRKNTGFLGG